MTTKIFDESQFIPTQWNTSTDKAKFANHMIRFIESDYNENLFYKWFYTRLSMCFGHIAHYNKVGFYDTWFSSKDRQTAFLDHTLRYPCYGDPGWTYSDVENVIQEHLIKVLS